ncbi:MAG: heavy metal translocating P-type ATPase [Clostridia bacterium]|nr:heavy metal translocating P-type ATPase [Clostridia bacterium]
MEKYIVTGMSCAACSARVEGAVGSLDGVTSCSVNLLTGDMLVEGGATRAEVIAAVEAAGYGIRGGAEKSELQEDKSADREGKIILLRLIFSAIILLPLMYISMGGMLGLAQPFFFEENPIAVALTQLLLSALIMVINQKFFINGFKGAVRLAPNMDTLVSLGSAVSFVYSVALLYLMVADPINAHHYLHGLYFESAAMILVLISLGKLLEARAKGRTTDAIKSLMSLSAKTVTVIRDGEELEIPREELREGDIFLVKPGERIATDGEVLEGESAVDESAITGESLPVDKRIGSRVIGGTLNTSGSLRCRATKVGEGTLLAEIIRMVKDASATKAPIARLADRVSGVFVPVVLGISLLTLIGWLIYNGNIGDALSHAITVLVISCPCALGLATPVAIMVGTGVGAKRGVLYKNATSLEECGRVKTVILDKTGTVTRGEPLVTDVVLADGVSEEALGELALSLESLSEHPLALAVVKKYEGLKTVSVEDFEALTGRGVYGKIDGEPCFGVSLDYAKKQTIVDEIIERDCLRLAKEGKTPILFIKGERVIGALGVADVIKADAKEGVGRLRALGLRVVMLTGDNKAVAERIAKEVGIEEVVAGVLPSGKEQIVREMMQDGRVAMVGDGINDAPALTRASVGMAIGRGTDVAIDSAGVVLMGDGLSVVADAIELGRATLANIRQNLFWAFLYNSIGIPLAIGLFGLALQPMFGAAAMSLSSLCVVLNALRLNLFKPRRYAESENEEEIKIQIQESEEKEMEKVIRVEGMMCPHCEARVKATVEAIEGVAAAVASHKEGTVTVTLVKEVAEGVIEAAITAQGYTVL